MKNKILVGMSVALFSAVAATVVLSYLNAGLRRDLRQKNDMLRGATIENTVSNVSNTTRNSN